MAELNIEKLQNPSRLSHLFEYSVAIHNIHIPYFQMYFFFKFYTNIASYNGDLQATNQNDVIIKYH